MNLPDDMNMIPAPDNN